MLRSAFAACLSKNVELSAKPMLNYALCAMLSVDIKLCSDIISHFA